MVTLLSVVMLNGNNGECHYAECHYAKCRGANLGPIVRNILDCSLRIKLVCLNVAQIYCYN